MVVVLAGCPKLEQDAYNTIVGANAFCKQEQAKHPECANGGPSTLCVDLKKAVAAKDALIDATEAYCAGPDFNNGGPCDPPAKGTPAATQATAKLQAALSLWSQTESDLKGVAQ